MGNASMNALAFAAKQQANVANSAATSQPLNYNPYRRGARTWSGVVVGQYAFQY